MVVLTVFYVAGILTGELTNIKSSVALAMAGFCFLAAVAGYVVAWRENRRVILILFLLLGLALSRLAVEGSETQLTRYSGRWVTLIGQVVAEPDVREDKVFYLLQARELLQGGERRAAAGAVRLQLKESNRVFGYGDVLSVSGLLARPELPGNPGGFNYRTYLERQGISVVLMARGEKAVEKIGDNLANPLLNIALRLKQKLSSIAVTSLTPSHASVLNGIVFGTQGLIDKETRQAFTETGIVHILSVSGLHIGLVMGGMAGLLRLLKLPPVLTAPLITPVLAFYALMTGINPAVLRATVMALFLLWAHHLGRDRDWPTTMALAALVILLWNPLQIYHPGFQLSFAATWGILYLGPVFSKAVAGFLKGLPAGFPSFVSQALATPLAAQMATVPLVAWYYNLFSPVSIPANLVAVPLVGLIMLFGVFATVSGLVWLPLAGLINLGNGVVLSLFTQVVSFFQNLPGAVFYLSTPPLVLAVVWYGGLLATGWLLSGGCSPVAKERIKGWIIVGVVLGAALLLIWMPWKGGPGMTVHFLDVGQGDSILVQTSGGRNMLIDTGGRPGEFQTGTGAGDQVVTPYLRKIGVRRLDVLVLTHPHEDHFGGAAAIFNYFPIGMVLVTHVDEKDCEGGGVLEYEDTTSGNKKGESDLGEEIPAAYTTLLARITAAGVPVRVAGAGDTLRLDRETVIEVLSPGEMTGESKAYLNNQSLVLKLTYRHKSFIFTGDVEVEAQKGLLNREADLKANVFKVPHHGSQSLLPELVEQVKPEVAVISVGAHNNFGHPAQSTLDMLYRAGARVCRTDQDGAVIMRTDGYKLDVKGGKN
ncbi:MAG: ComEC family competence protein [Pelotomaculum sp. PtaU1.Bin035]|nr:MAG: ComEC family competence protein [Pelotomaculum sp. PtaU1.Bin035]